MHSTANQHGKASLLSNIGVLLFGLAVTAFVLWPFLTGVLTFIRDGDSSDQSFSWLVKIFTAIRNGELVLWDFSILSGVSFIGELQTSPLYPPAWLFGFFGNPRDPLILDLFLAAHFLFALFGFHLFARSLGLGRLSSLFGAVVFTFGTSFSVKVNGQPNLFASLAWMPWIVLAVRLSLIAVSLERRLLAAILAGVATAMAFNAGHAHSVILALVAAGGYAVISIFEVKTWRERLARLAFSGAIGGVVAFGLALPQILATREYLKLAYKWYGAGNTQYPHVVPFAVFSEHSMHVGDLKSLINNALRIAPDGATLFFTLTGLICAVFALTYVRQAGRYKSYIVWTAVLLLFILSFAFSSIPLLGQIYYHVPILNLVRTPVRGLFVYAFAAAVLASIGVELIRGVSGKFLLQVFGTHGQRLSMIVPLALIAIAVFEVQQWLPRQVGWPRSAQGVELAEILDGAVGKKLIELSNDGPLEYRYFADRTIVPPNLGNIFPVLAARGYRSSIPMAYHDYRDFGIDSTRLDALAVRWWVTKDPIENLKLVADVDGKLIYERPNAMPVFWLSNDDGTRVAPEIEAINWGANEVRVVFAKPVSGKLIFAQTEYPGFYALADGERHNVSTFDHLMSVDLAGPTSVVRFIYDPAWWKPSTDIALATLALLLAGMVIAFSSDRARKTDHRPVGQTSTMDDLVDAKCGAL